ncbi:LysM domain-containing protein [Leptothermofonsia sichuanensis E412]|uniref:LysM domain-containing protein n=1 Tax=Leptothermofonsia sichuanensis TaxID=2917832 RepID=UPI001CA6B227|nr:LysM domain-containing protein [Leptothermofonsia sichuanensis]QZZ20615.1 LysM domain-containing protein [Leptothermofonsia sichuanensis E412]
MMVDPVSRYAPLETVQMTLPDGRTVAYKRRRFLPQGRTLPVLTTVTVMNGDRLDLIADRTLGNALLFWQVCDANNAMNPIELTAEPERTLRIPIPQV